MRVGNKDVFEGHAYRDGSLKQKIDYKKAVMCYEKAAKVNNAEGIFNLAMMNLKGYCVTLNIP